MLYGSIFSLHNIFAILERISQIASIITAQLSFVYRALEYSFVVRSVMFGSVLGNLFQM